MITAVEHGKIDCARVLVKELGCNKDAQDKVTVTMCVQVCRPLSVIDKYTLSIHKHSVAK